MKQHTKKTYTTLEVSWVFLNKSLVPCIRIFPSPLRMYTLNEVVGATQRVDCCTRQQIKGYSSFSLVKKMHHQQCSGPFICSRVVGLLCYVCTCTCTCTSEQLTRQGCKHRIISMQTVTFMMLLTQNEASLVARELFGLWQCCSRQRFDLRLKYVQNVVRESDGDTCLEMQLASRNQHGILKLKRNVYNTREVI